MAFEWKEALPGVFHIRDGMGVCMTLLRGEKRALLVDTGYGAEDVAAFARKEGLEGHARSALSRGTN